MPAAQTPGTASAPAHGAPDRVETAVGTVAETMNAGSYTYVRVTSGSRELWAATSQFPVAVGDRVSVPLESPMQNFHSQSLNRDFPLIYFASHIDREGAPMAGGSPHGSAAPGVAAATAVAEPIAPPAGGLSIEKVWSDRKALAGRTVTVRGKVVKYNAGIMDRNWIHIQDGSGKAADGTHDLTITTRGTTKLGDVIEASGTIGLDRDFGASYKYAVIIENGTIK